MVYSVYIYDIGCIALLLYRLESSKIVVILILDKKYMSLSCSIYDFQRKMLKIPVSTVRFIMIPYLEIRTEIVYMPNIGFNDIGFSVKSKITTAFSFPEVDKAVSTHFAGTQLADYHR